MAKLRSQAGVKSVSRVLRLSRSAVTSPYTPNDPYYKGYPGTGAPYYESASIGGEWDMHAIGLGSAWGYSQSANGSGITNAGALGSSSVRLAVIDTGEDLTSPELGNGKVVRSECFITDENGNQSASTYVTDQDGHGTDVAGIATALVNNGVGFVGTGGKVSLMAYRVFPTPDDNCLNDSSSDDQCSASSTDIASAIDDAVANGANVINLSFGSGTGSSCQDDNVEGPAIANAIANNVIVVAAAGNAGASSVDVPACDPGVIAAGASALADGQTNGSGVGGSGEYVASYSNYASSNTTRWGIVAPGGDPYCPNTNGGCTDTDYLHWIYHIYTSTPLDSNYAGLCAPDDGTTAPIDCRILIAGTSMAAPHIAGAAALIVAANPAYQSPSAMFQLLCSTADNIGAAHQGCGRLDVEHAMGVAVGDPSPGTAALKQ
jgi:subtilisin family serine protease